MSNLRLAESRIALRPSRLSARKCILRTAALLAIFCSPSVAQKTEFHWNWREGKDLSWEDSLRNAKVQSATGEAVAKAVAARLKDELIEDTEAQLEKVALDSRVYFVDLNGDGTRELVVQVSGEELCSVTGNCPFWIFEKIEDRYRPILDNGFAQTFTIQPTKTNGYKDIVTGMHGSATMSGLTLFKFRGGSYHESGCYEANWQILEGDKVRELKEPRITTCK